MDEEPEIREREYNELGTIIYSGNLFTEIVLFDTTQIILLYA